MAADHLGSTPFTYQAGAITCFRGIPFAERSQLCCGAFPFAWLIFTSFSFCKRVEGVTDKDRRRLHFISAYVKQIALNGISTRKDHARRMARVTTFIRLAQ